jgi:hypothetical protein
MIGDIRSAGRGGAGLFALPVRGLHWHRLPTSVVLRFLLLTMRRGVR